MQIIKDTLSWAAGIFEGEGTIYKNIKRRQFCMAVKMKDEDIIKRFHKVVKFGRVKVKILRSPYNYPFWEWTLTRTNDILILTNILLPYMGKRRTKQILQAIDGKSFIKEKQNLTIVPECGYMLKGEISSRGAIRHVNIGEKPCPTCAENQREYLRQWRKKTFYEANK